MPLKFKTVILGCGAISKNHIDAIQQNTEHYALAGVYDIDATRAAAVADQTQARAYTDMDQMFSEVKPDVAAIATPSAAHADQALYCMDHGSHLVLEKPIALSTADIDAVAAAQARTGRKIAVGYVLRYAPHIRLLAKAIELGRFGRIFHVGLSVYWNRNDEYYTSAPWRGTWMIDGGTLMNQATHGIDLLQWILGGRPQSASGTMARFLRPIEAEDFATATIRFSNGGIGTVNVTVDTYSKNHGTRLTILGEHGTVELCGNGPDSIAAWQFREIAEWSEIDEFVRNGTWSADDALLTGHAGVYQDLAAAIHNDRAPVSDLETSRVSAEIVLGIQKSHRTQATVDFPVSFSTEEMVGSAL